LEAFAVWAKKSLVAAF